MSYEEWNELTKDMTIEEVKAMVAAAKGITIEELEDLMEKHPWGSWNKGDVNGNNGNRCN